MHLLALGSTGLGGTIGGAGLGPFGAKAALLSTSGQEALVAVTSTISKIIGILTVAATIWFIFQLLVGGIAWITAGGDKAKLNEARDRLTNAFVGLLIVVAGWSILALVGQFFGFDILITNPGGLINSLGL